MTYRYRSSQNTKSDLILVVALVFIALWLMSCQTIQAVTDAPTEFWMTLELILDALWADVLSLVDLLL